MLKACTTVHRFVHDHPRKWSSSFKYGRKMFCRVHVTVAQCITKRVTLLYSVVERDFLNNLDAKVCVTAIVLLVHF